MTSQRPHVLLKFISLFSVVRVNNIFLMVLAQYLAAIYVLNGSLSFKEVLFDKSLMLIVFSSAASIAAGYIINNFYDRKKDFINRPHKSMIDSMVSDQTKLGVFFVTSLIVFVLAYTVSVRALFFFGSYIFGMWIYSAFLRRYPILSNIISSLLVVTPFLAITIHYRSFDAVIFVQAFFLLLLLSSKKIVKDMKSLQGDMAANLLSIPLKYGIRSSKNLFYGLLFFVEAVSLCIVNYFLIGHMIYYFWLSALVVPFMMFLMKNATTTRQFWLIDNTFKVWVVIGVLSLALFDATI